MSETFSNILAAVEAVKRGDMVLVCDDENRENEGDIIIAAEKITPDHINFMMTHARGLICLPMSTHMLDRLGIPMMVGSHANKSQYETAFTVSIDAATGVTTGVSAHDRAHTTLTAIHPNTTSADLTMPGHMFPLRARDNGVLERAGHTEASIDLAKLAGCSAAAVICEIMAENGRSANREELAAFAKKHRIPMIDIHTLIAYRKAQVKNTTAI